MWQKETRETKFNGFQNGRTAAGMVAERKRKQMKAKTGDRGVEIGTRRVSSWKAGCTCALNLHAMDPAQLEFRSMTFQ